MGVDGEHTLRSSIKLAIPRPPHVVTESYKSRVGGPTLALTLNICDDPML